MDSFLNELWHRKAEDETMGHTSEELASPEMEMERFEKKGGVAVYKTIKKQAEYDEATRELFKELERLILNYYNAIMNLEKLSIMSHDRTMVGEADHARRLAHDSVISTLNALSRYTGKHGLDNEWRSVIGLERTQVTDWVKDVAPYIILNKNRGSRK